MSASFQTDFANRDARAAFFTRVETGEPPRGFPPVGPGDMYNPNMGPRGGGMMMPRPGMHMMGMGRGFPPPGTCQLLNSNNLHVYVCMCICDSTCG